MHLGLSDRSTGVRGPAGGFRNKSNGRKQGAVRRSSRRTSRRKRSSAVMPATKALPTLAAATDKVPMKQTLANRSRSTIVPSVQFAGTHIDICGADCHMASVATQRVCGPGLKREPRCNCSARSSTRISARSAWRPDWKAARQKVAPSAKTHVLNVGRHCAVAAEQSMAARAPSYSEETALL
jgi:hypothetical protein